MQKQMWRRSRHTRLQYKALGEDRRPPSVYICSGPLLLLGSADYLSRCAAIPNLFTQLLTHCVTHCVTLCNTRKQGRVHKDWLVGADKAQAPERLPGLTH